MSHNYNVLIIGGGASGLMCACSLASLGVTGVAVAERNDKLGKKLLMTGNGRCNVTNNSITAKDYNTDDYEKLQAILECYDTSYTKDFFEKELKVKLSSKGDLVYPRTYRSDTVLCVRITVSNSSKIHISTISAKILQLTVTSVRDIS